jgi:hypothetical protein
MQTRLPQGSASNPTPSKSAGYYHESLRRADGKPVSELGISRRQIAGVLRANSIPQTADIQMKKQQVRHWLTRLGELAAHPAAFGVIAVYAVAWLIFSPATFGWSAIASLATWLMTLGGLE